VRLPSTARSRANPETIRGLWLRAAAGFFGPTVIAAVSASPLEMRAAAGGWTASGRYDLTRDP